MSRAAQKLLERMRAAKTGWGPGDVKRLLTGFGFDLREGRKHSIYQHPRHTDLTLAVPRHKELRAWVIKDAVKLVDNLTAR